MITVNPLIIPLYGITLALDIVMFFLIIRLLTAWKPTPLLEGFNKAGKPIVDYFINLVGEHIYRKKQTMLTSNSKIWLSLGLVSVVRFLLTALMHLCL